MPKPRPHGTGSITHRKDGRWQGRYSVDGRAHYVYAKTKPECNRLLLAAIKESKQPKQPPGQQLLSTYLLDWLEKDKSIEYRANSYAQRSYVVRKQLIPEFGALRLDQITADHAREWLIKIAYLAPSTIRSYYGALHTALEDAVENGLLEINPLIRVRRPKKVKPEHVILDMEQAYKLCAQMAGHWIEPLAKMAIATAMRKGELLSLKWADVDLAKGVNHVRRNVAYVPVRKHVPGPAKTKSSERTITLTDFGIETLKNHRLTQIALKLTMGTQWQDNDLVFPGERGNYRIPNSINRTLDRMLLKADLPRITVHELRHSAVSILLAMGVNIKVIQELCGHSSIVITLELYAHLLPDMQGAAMQKFGAAWAEMGQKDVKTGAEGEEKGA